MNVAPASFAFDPRLREAQRSADGFMTSVKRLNTELVLARAALSGMAGTFAQAAEIGRQEQARIRAASRNLGRSISDTIAKSLTDSLRRGSDFDTLLRRRWSEALAVVGGRAFSRISNEVVLAPLIEMMAADHGWLLDLLGVGPRNRTGRFGRGSFPIWEQNMNIGPSFVKGMDSWGAGTLGMGPGGWTNASLSQMLGAAGTGFTIGSLIGKGWVGGGLGAAGGAAGMALGSNMGTILGLPGGPVGALIGSLAGGLLSNLFGGGKPHPAASYEAALGAGNALVNPSVGSKHMDSARVEALGARLGDFVGKLGAAFGADFAGNVGVAHDERGQGTFLFHRQAVEGSSEGLRTEFVFDPENAKSVETAFARLAVTLLRTAETVEDVQVRTAAANISLDQSGEDILRQLDFAANFQAIIDGLAAGTADYSKTVTAQAEARAEQVRNQIAEWRAMSEQLGLPIGAMTRAAREFALQAAHLSAAPQKLTAVQQAVAEVSAEIAALAPLFEDLGLDSARLSTGLANAIAGMRGAYMEQIEDGILALVAPGEARLAALAEAHETAMIDARALGLSTAELGRVELLYALQRAQVASEMNAELVRAAEQSRSQWGGLLERIQDFALGLKLDPDLSILAPEQRLEEARAAYAEIAAKAKLGDADAVEKLPAAAQALLEASRSYYASSAPYAADFAQVQADAANVQSLAERQVALAEQQLAEARAQSSLLDQIREAVVLQGYNAARDWGADPATNMMLAAATGYLGDFGGGKFTAWVERQLAAAGDPRIGSRNRALDFGQPANQGLNMALSLLGGYQGDFGGEGATSFTAWAADPANLAGLTELQKQAMRQLLYAHGMVPGFARGGVHGGGWAVVGEEGPELAWFGGTARIYSAPDTARLLANDNDVVAELRALREENRQMREELGEIGRRQLLVSAEGARAIQGEIARDVAERRGRGQRLAARPVRAA